MFAAAVMLGLYQMGAYVISAWQCRDGSASVLAVGLLSLAISLIGVWISWKSYRWNSGPAPDSGAQVQGRPRAFLAQVALGTAGILLLAMIFQIAASAFLPACAG
jgi:hypothetical protein